MLKLHVGQLLDERRALNFELESEPGLEQQSTMMERLRIPANDQTARANESQRSLGTQEGARGDLQNELCVLWFLPVTEIVYKVQKRGVWLKVAARGQVV